MPRVRHLFARMVGLLVVALLVASCGNEGGESATTAATAAVVSGLGLDRPVLVTNTDGVFQIGTDATVNELLDAPVAVAVGDTQGGLLYQVESGRSREPDDRSTIVWWIPRRASGAQELLVPAPSSGHELTLHDTYPTASGFAVLYTRHETAEPVDEMVDSLRRFDIPDRQVTELSSQGAIGQAYDEVSVGGGLISGTWYGEVGSECFLLDLQGRRMDMVPPVAGDPGEDEYISGCGLSRDGSRLAFVTRGPDDTTVHVRHLETGDEIRFEILGSEGRVGTVDLSDRTLLVNLERDGPLPAMVFDLDAPEAQPHPLPVAGVARFLNRPVDISGEAASPTTSTEAATTASSTTPAPTTTASTTATTATETGVVLRGDGLGVAAFGDPEDSVMNSLTSLFGAPDRDEIHTGPWPIDTGCHGATGYGCVDYLRFVEWDGLVLVFTDGSPTGAAVPPTFKGWAYSGQAGLSTASGVSVGTTVEELQNLPGDLTLPEQPDECIGLWMATIDGVGLFLDGDPADLTTEVTRLFAGEALGSC